MLLENNFYTIAEQTITEGALCATFRINPRHLVFKGHFPEQPVVPGVCMIQILKELLEAGLQRQLFLKSSRQIKFLQLLVPDAADNLSFLIHFDSLEGAYAVEAQLKKADQVMFKFQGTFSVLADV